jgi:hypothetical protein
MTQREWEELRPYLRDERPPDDAAVVVRGGPDTLAKLATHARRTHDAYILDGEPLWGISVYCALDDVGPASLDGLLRRFASYRAVHLCLKRTNSAAPGFRCCRRSAARTTQSGSTAMIRPR